MNAGEGTKGRVHTHEDVYIPGVEEHADSSAQCIHDVPGGCWLCKEKSSKDSEQALPETTALGREE